MLFLSLSFSNKTRLKCGFQIHGPSVNIIKTIFGLFVTTFDLLSYYITRK